MLWIGYMTMCKCCMYSVVVCIGIPCLYYYIRRNGGGERAPEGLGNNVLTNLAVSKFENIAKSMEDNEVNKSCTICLGDFETSDDVTALPCNVKHTFHTPCITNWLKERNICPLCKAPVTQAELDRAAKAAREA